MNSRHPSSRISLRVSPSQLDLLLDFIHKHPILNKGVLVGKSKLVYQKLWTKIASRLNADKYGSHKDPVQWKRYWISMKNKVKTKTISLSRQREAGLKRLIYLTDYDKKVLSIIAKEGKLMTPSGDNLIISDMQNSDESEQEDREIARIGENFVMTDLSHETAEEMVLQPSDCAVECDSESPRGRVSLHQQQLLVEFMEGLPALALSRSRGRREQQRANRSWEKIAEVMNRVDPGNCKSGHGWLRYWTTMKCALRSRYLAAREAGRSDAMEGFTPLHLRILRVIIPNEECDDKSLKYVEFDLHPTELVNVAGDSTPLKEEFYNHPDDEDNKNSLIEEFEDLTDDPIVDPIDTTIEKKEHTRRYRLRQTKEDLQTELLRFQLQKEKEMHILEMARQKEMHALQMKQQKERHVLEIEILNLKKKRLLLEYNRNRNLHITVQQYNQNES